MTGSDRNEKSAVRLPLAARCALVAYPPWWRERYGQDQESFLEALAVDHRPLGRAVLDLAVGAVRVRLRPAGMPQTVGAWRDRARASIAWATVPALVALLLVSAIEQRSFGSSTDAGSASLLSTGGRVAADAMTSFAWASIAMVVLLLIGWALVGRLAGTVARGRAGKRWLSLVTAPLACGVVEAVLSVLRAGLVAHVVVSAGGHSRLVYRHPLAAQVASVAWGVVAVAGLLSIFGVVLAARSADLRVRDLRGGVWLSQATAVVLFVAAFASIAWGLGVTHQPPIPRADLIGSGPGLRPWAGVQSSIGAEWPLISSGLAVVSVVSARAALIARRSYNAARELAAIGS
ncbi:MAG: hypothetical protein ABSA65_11200 [Acidimicrobiales bacterium]